MKCHLMSRVIIWRSGRVVEGVRLESGYTLIAYRGFESLLLRQIIKTLAIARVFLLLLISRKYSNNRGFARFNKRYINIKGEI